MPNYTCCERADMIFMEGGANGNDREARLYQKSLWRKNPLADKGRPRTRSTANFVHTCIESERGAFNLNNTFRNR